MSNPSGFLAGKKLLITGVLSNRSIAYGIARACRNQGAELAFSYVGERFKDRITDFAAEFDSKLIFDCDVGSDEQIEAMFKDLSATWPTFDGFVHGIGFAPREAIAGNFLDGSLTGKKGITYNQRASVCLETQKYPDTPNKPEWPSAVLRPGEKYNSHCIFKFSVDNGK